MIVITGTPLRPQPAYVKRAMARFRLVFRGRYRFPEEAVRQEGSKALHVWLDCLNVERANAYNHLKKRVAP